MGIVKKLLLMEFLTELAIRFQRYRNYHSDNGIVIITLRNTGYDQF